MSDFRNSFEIGDNVVGVTQAFNVNGSCLVINGSREVFKLAAADKGGGDAVSWKEIAQLVVSATVQMRACDNILARLGKGSECQKLGSLARRCCKSGDPSL